MAGVASAVLTVSGLLALRFKGAARAAPVPVRPVAAWLALSLGLGLAVHAAGPDLGIPAWIGVVGVTGFAIAGLLAEKSDGRHRKPERTRSGNAEPRAKESVLSKPRGFLAVIHGTLFAVGMALAAAALLPLPRDDRALLAVVLAPIVWAGAVLYLFAASSWKRANLLLAGAATLALLGAALAMAG